MTGWVIQFDGTIFAGTPFNRMSKKFDFCGEGIVSNDPDYDDDHFERDGAIFKAIAEHFKIRTPFTISLRVWHPSNIPKYHFKKAWVNP
jgi:hypothetical protein